MTQSMADDVAYRFHGGTRLRLVHPTTALETFNYKGATGAIDVELAKFGRFQTGTSIVAPLFFPPLNFDGCNSMVAHHIATRFNMEWKGFVILMDGGCTWEEKARRVESMGAQALIIASEDSSFIDTRVFHDSESPYDGSGGSISIPTLVVNSKHGQALIDMVRGKENFSQDVVLKADIDIANSASQTISYTLFYGSIVDLDSNLILRLYEY